MNRRRHLCSHGTTNRQMMRLAEMIYEIRRHSNVNNFVSPDRPGKASFEI